MAVVSVNLVSDGQSAKTSDGRTYRSVWRVITDSATDTPYTARNAAGIPGVGDAHTDDASAKATNVVADYESPGKEGSRKHYKVTATYSTPTSRTPEEDPLDDPVQVSWGHTAYTEVVWADQDGDLIQNSAGVRFNPGLERTRHYSTCTIVRNEETFSATTARDYIDRVNSDTFELDGYTIGPRAAMCMDYSASTQTRNDTDYYQVRYEFVLKDATWDVVVLDEGLSEWVDPADHSADRKKIAEGGKPVTQPKQLDGSGSYAAVGAAPVWLTFQINATAVFSSLNVGSL